MLPEEARKNVINFLNKENEEEKKIIKELIDEEYNLTIKIIKDNSLKGESEFSNMLYYKMSLGNKNLMNYPLNYPSRKIMEYVAWGLESKMRELGYKTEFDENHLLQMFVVRIKW